MSQPKPSRRPVAIGVGVALALLVVVAVVAHRPSDPQSVAPMASATRSFVAPSSSTTRSAPSLSASAEASRSAHPTSPASPTLSPTTRPTPTPTPAGPDTSLKTNSLYRIDLDRSSTRCEVKVRDPKPPLRNKALAPYLRDVVDCLVETFDRPVAAEGFELTTPQIRTYAKTISTPCGKYSQNRAPAFYCSATQTIYWPLSGDDDNEAYTFARLGYVALLAHEFGHHLQQVTGMLAEYSDDYYDADKSSPRYLLSRRLELQAQCFEGVFLNATTRSLRITADDRSQLRRWHNYTGDEDPPSSRLPDHGSSRAQIRWLERGLGSGDLGRCNTWKAEKADVK